MSLLSFSSLVSICLSLLAVFLVTTILRDRCVVLSKIFWLSAIKEPKIDDTMLDEKTKEEAVIYPVGAPQANVISQQAAVELGPAVASAQKIYIRKYEIVEPSSMDVDRSQPNFVENSSFCGIVLYQWNGRQTWMKNNVKYNTGSIIVQRRSVLELEEMDEPPRSDAFVGDETDTETILHAKLYHSVFGTNPKEDSAVGSAFGYEEGDGWNWKSELFVDYENEAPTYMSGHSKMNRDDRQHVQQAVTKWIQDGHIVLHLEHELCIPLLTPQNASSARNRSEGQPA